MRINEITYAQNREDILISGFFGDVKEGFYVDVGANEPVHDSVTKYFYDRGWHGINIEPIPTLFQKLKAARPRDISLQVGIAAKKGETILHYYPQGNGLSTLSAEMAREHKARGDAVTKDEEELRVQVLPLRDVLKEYANGQTIHFMKIDVEGFEAQVIKSNDWLKFRPQLLCIEANHIFDGWERVLLDNKYTKVFFDGLNDYYVAEEAVFRAKDFSYVETMIGKAPVHYSVAKKIAEYDRMAKKTEQLVAISEQNEQKIRQLEQEIARPKTAKEAVRTAVVAAHHANLRTIEKLKPSATARVFTDTADAKELLHLVQDYDTKNEEVLNARVSLKTGPYLVARASYGVTIKSTKMLERFLRKLAHRIRK